MDQERQIRFLIPPFFLFSSLLWGIYWSDPVHLHWHDLIQGDLLKYIGIAAASALPLGYLIGTFTVLFLKLFSLIIGHNYEALFSLNTLVNMSEAIGKKTTENEFKNMCRFQKMRIELNTAAVFDHEFHYNNSKGTHEWVMRRWNAVNISFNSITALLFAILSGCLLKIPIKAFWTISTLILAAMFLTTGILAWRDIFKMFEFQSIRYKAIIKNRTICKIDSSCRTPGAERNVNR